MNCAVRTAYCDTDYNQVELLCKPFIKPNDKDNKQPLIPAGFNALIESETIVYASLPEMSRLLVPLCAAKIVNVENFRPSICTVLVEFAIIPQRNFI